MVLPKFPVNPLDLSLTVQSREEEEESLKVIQFAAVSFAFWELIILAMTPLLLPRPPKLGERKRNPNNEFIKVDLSVKSTTFNDF